MPEATEDAALLIATSWQALERAKDGDPETTLTNCTVILVFAAFFIEANLNHIIEILGREADVAAFFKPRQPGLLQKLGWYYSEYAAGSKASTPKELNDEALRRELVGRFPGLSQIHGFRNDVAHGHIDRTLATPEEAKKIVSALFLIAEAAGRPMPRLVTYSRAISSQPFPEP